MTLRDALDTRDNALNFVRLVFAGLVIVSHTWPLGGLGADPHLGDLSLGSFAVAGFFAISGYLITGSRMRLGSWQFALRRALRIFPGFWVCLGVVGFVFAPLTAMANGIRFDPSRAASYVGSNVTTVMLQYGVGTELKTLPEYDVWDGSLWTLRYEIMCYILTGLIMCSSWVRQHLARVAGSLCILLPVLNVAFAQAELVGGVLVFLLQLAAYFAAGSILWSLRDRVRVNSWWLAGSAALLVVLMFCGVAHLVGALPVALLVLEFGALCPIRWGVDRDLSYGVYIYAWPVQQMLVLAGVAKLGPVAFMGATMACMAPLARLSWTFVERPGLRLVRRRPSVAALADGVLH